ncbi:concanavalin A-like lectin/glucanase domain-containing protein [Leptodontidium sp. 2 PMI_412]|nr:concanavalin A-like lectin/glucanase domain-containing protein [Leptodontidium sp. 2 PMI_412]
MYPATIAGFALLWYDSFTRFTSPPERPYRYWDAIKKYDLNDNNRERQYYDTNIDLTYMKSYPPSAPGSNPDQLFITPQFKDGQWKSARLEGKVAHKCDEGKALILQAELQVGTASSDKQAGVWPAFWALGESLYKEGSEKKPWPLCGEWDIFETSDGHDWNLASVHWASPAAPDGEKNFPEGIDNTNVDQHWHEYDHTKFHTWAIQVDRRPSNWKDETIQFKMDGNVYFEIKGSDIKIEEEWAILAHQAYFPVLNVAIGSNFPRSAGIPNTADPTTGLDIGMTVNYVAFYESE